MQLCAIQDCCPQRWSPKETGSHEQQRCFPVDGVLFADAARAGAESSTERPKTAYCSVKLWFKADEKATAALEFAAAPSQASVA